ncbi:MAG: hypothetical protein IT443_01740 [Phycisphaeraceae bacterium]|nr:hypothetical protein [Phycisphaeraceae bacterium]
MSTTPLRDLVSQRLNLRWAEWSAAHPHLAGVIDRTRLVEQTVEKLRDDPDFQLAMRQADVDEARLGSLLFLLEQADKWIGRLLPL